MIVGAAMVEGAAFLAVFAYLLDRTTLSLALAVVLIAGVTAHFPTRSRVEHWIEGQLQLLDHPQNTSDTQH